MGCVVKGGIQITHIIVSEFHWSRRQRVKPLAFFWARVTRASEAECNGDTGVSCCEAIRDRRGSRLDKNVDRTKHLVSMREYFSREK